MNHIIKKKMNNNSIVMVHILKHGKHGIHKVRIEGRREHDFEAVLITRNNVHMYIEGRSLAARIVRIRETSIDLVPVSIG